MRNLINDSFEIFDYFELSPDLVCIAGRDGFFRKINQSVINALGYTREELFAAPISSFIHVDDRERTSNNRNKLLTGEILQNFQNRYVTKSGTILWLEWTSIYFAAKEIVLAIAKDITAKKEIELAIQNQYKKFKDLTTYFKGSIEKERRYLAYELHEDVAQLAAVVKMNIDLAVTGADSLAPPVKNHLENAIATTSLLIQTIQKISFAVSPYMLEEFGMNMTINWLCEEFGAHNNIRCRFESDYDERCLTREIQIDFFRICQEALKNVIMHAEATAVAVSICEKDGKIQLCIKDNGKGFVDKNTADTQGILSMQERTASVHGTFNINSEPGKGTEVCVTIPKPVI